MIPLPASHTVPVATSFSSKRRPIKSSTGPINELPPTRWIITEAERLALEAFTEALRRRRPPHKSPTQSREGNDFEAPGSPDNVSQSPRGSPRNIFLNRKPEAHQVFRAIEDQDLSILANVAEYDFGLLLRPLSSGTNQTPLNHAIDCGPSHRGVALLLLGMFSRYVNHLSDTDFDQPAARETLRLLRVNFALAMNRGVMHATDDSLAASFLQVYIMSKGQQWLSDTITQTAIALRGSVPGEPVALAGNAVRKYAGRMLKKDEIIATLEDYVGNATADLLMMAAWECVRNGAPNEDVPPIPLHYFARDERVFNAFTEKLEQHRELVHHSKFVGRRLRAQLAVLQKYLEGRTTTYRSKVIAVDQELNGLCGT
ncbi:hypothetical protein MSAN_02069900 [Mycena sanguinolenta]|uniref:Uncharacterized protein n=1 Tax=Mycena sanguinolenta TaxID=230812 RepID=A0A8H6XHQ1_9AGAR|nr:hypothetical protein MSAN_02069900 [Mycena sanguinolenta]